MPNVPHIAGESEMYLRKQLGAFRSGVRRDEMMTIVAGDLPDQPTTLWVDSPSTGVPCRRGGLTAHGQIRLYSEIS